MPQDVGGKLGQNEVVPDLRTTEICIIVMHCQLPFVIVVIITASATFPDLSFLAGSKLFMFIYSSQRYEDSYYYPILFLRELVCVCSVAQLCPTATPRTAAHQAPLSMASSRQEHWSGLPFPPPGHLLNPGIETASPGLVGGFFTTSATWEAPERT